MENEIGFRMTIWQKDVILYAERMPPMPVPRIGDDVFIPMGANSRLWTVKSIRWALPSIGAMTPTMQVDVEVAYSSANPLPIPDLLIEGDGTKRR